MIGRFRKERKEGERGREDKKRKEGEKGNEKRKEGERGKEKRKEGERGKEEIFTSSKILRFSLCLHCFTSRTKTCNPLT